MSAADSTKQAIVSGTKELVSTKSYEKVSVIEISRICGINRNTFYYHFTDKYAVIEWIFHNEIEPVIEKYMAKDYWADSVVHLCRHMKSEKKFYTNALTDRGQCSLYQILVDYYKKALMKSFQEDYERLGILGDAQEIVARFFSHGTIDMICDWVAGGMRKDADVSTQILDTAIRASLFK